MKPKGVTYRRAGELRRRMTPPEARLWLGLKNQSLGGLKFRRQHPVGPYILDFYCAAARLAVEVDGQGHDHPDQVDHDRRRTEWLGTYGVAVMRFPALSIRDHLPEVLEAIRMKASERLPE